MAVAGLLLRRRLVGELAGLAWQPRGAGSSVAIDATLSPGGLRRSRA